MLPTISSDVLIPGSGGVGGGRRGGGGGRGIYALSCLSYKSEKDPT